MDTARRVKYSLMLLLLVGAGLAMLASTQNWFAITLVPSAEHAAVITVQGSTAAPALTALALAGIALAAALAIAGRIARIVLGVLGAIVGVCILISTISAVDDPIGTSASAITTATGVAGRDSVARLVATADVEFWAWIGLAGGIIVILAGLAVPFTNRLWPDASRRFETVRFESPGSDDGTEDDARVQESIPSRRATPPPTNSRDMAIDSWDELSHGSDPTEHGGAASGETTDDDD